MFQKLAIPDVILVTPKRHGDARGFFSETYRAEAFEEAGIPGPFIQDNHAYSQQPGVLRGLHFQKPPHAQAKLVRCTQGAIYDVAVDIRQGSPTYGRYVGAELSAENGAQLYVPEGFAHGYLTLTPDCHVQYKTSAYYAPETEGGLAWDDPELGIEWPMEGLDIILSDKDKILPPLSALAPVF
ncbi:MAG: dTDP-4-dehydrorhamnose 3,5-epimerase [Henriciella sp.]|nr:dTDP-4-dehydrorhamnose 3,5-epimerase [Henriciella sp.]